MQSIYHNVKNNEIKISVLLLFRNTHRDVGIEWVKVRVSQSPYVSVSDYTNV